jgi:predicted RNase H-like HicB family nuclease
LFIIDIMDAIKTKNFIKRTVLLYPGEDGYFVAEVPSLPGCISQGKTRQEALENIQEAIELYIESLIQDGEIIPEDCYEVIKV